MTCPRGDYYPRELEQQENRCHSAAEMGAAPPAPVRVMKAASTKVNLLALPRAAARGVWRVMRRQATEPLAVEPRTKTKVYELQFRSLFSAVG